MGDGDADNGCSRGRFGSLAKVSVLLVLLLRGLLALGGGGSGASRGRVYVLVKAGFSSWDWIRIGMRGRGHCGVGGECPVDGLHIGEVFCLGKSPKLDLFSLLFLFCLWGARRGSCDGLSFGVTGMGK